MVSLYKLIKWSKFSLIRQATPALEDSLHQAAWIFTFIPTRLAIHSNSSVWLQRENKDDVKLMQIDVSYSGVYLKYVNL